MNNENTFCFAECDTSLNFTPHIDGLILTRTFSDCWQLSSPQDEENSGK
jgi:hypothetical protein